MKQESTVDLLLDVDQRPSFGKGILLSFQHVFAMFGATILVPLILGMPVSVALFASGVGTLIALKASNAPEELSEAKNALNLLFSKVEENLSYTLPNGDPRYITIVEKKKETPNKYPRKAGMPNKRPL